MEKMFIKSIVVSVILSLVFTVVLIGIGSLFEGVKRMGSFDATGLLSIDVAAVLFAEAWQIVKSSGLRK